MNKKEVYQSHLYEVLVQLLKEKFFAKGNHPFQKRILVLPDSSFKEKLFFQLTKQGRKCVLFNVSCFDVFEAVQELSSFVVEKKLTFPTVSVLGLHLESVIHEVLSDPDFFETDALSPLKDYIANKGKKEISAFANKLSSIFFQYGIYGGEFLSEFLVKDSWQKILFEKVFSSWNYPYELITPREWDKSRSSDESRGEIHLFHFSNMPHVFHQFFDKLSLHFDIIYYDLCLSEYQITELKSAKEKLHLLSRAKKMEVSAANERDLQKSLQNENFLLAEFGRMGREKNLFFEDLEYDIHSFFPKISTAEKNLLESLQEDLLYANSEHESKYMLRGSDTSFQIHSAPSYLREVESLYTTLVNLCSKKLEIQPCDIAVYAPDMSVYAPYIKMIFQNAESPFQIHFDERSLVEESSFLQAAIHFLSLEKSSFEKDEILHLFSLEPFRAALSITREESETFCKWMSDSNVRWGFDVAHREEFSKEKGGTHSLGSFSYSFEHLLYSLCVTDVDGFVDANDLRFYPLMHMPFSKASLLGKGVEFCQKLRRDLISFREDKTLAEWTLHLQSLCSTYFKVNDQEQTEVVASGKLHQAFEKLRELAKKVPNFRYPYSSIKKYLLDFLQKQTVDGQTSYQSISFSSIDNSIFTSNTVHALLGMSETSFPRKDAPSSLDLMQNLPQRDYIPSKIDEDRYTLLQLMHLTKEHLLVFYSNRNPADGAEQSFSPLWKEIFQHIKKKVMHASSLEEMIFVDHPSFGFDQKYFASDAKTKSFSSRMFRAASAYYNKMQEETVSFIPPCSSETSLLLENKTDEYIHISIAKLRKLARNPFQFYCNETLGIYLEEETKGDFQGEFILSPLQKAILSRSDEDQKDNASFIAQIKGEVPSGKYFDIAKEKIDIENELIHSNLKKFGLDASQLSTISLSNSCECTSIVSPNHYMMPAMHVPLSSGAIAIIEGTLSGVSPKGLCTYQKGGLDGAVQNLPSYLIYLNLKDSPIGIKPDMIFLKDGKQKMITLNNPHKQLQKYLEYYLLATSNPSPFYPSFAKSFFQGDEKELQKVMKQMLAESSFSLSDPYVKLAFSRNYDAKAIYEIWSPYLKNSIGSEVQKVFV